MTSRYVDLSHPITHEMITYPGLPGPTISTYTSREESAQQLATGVSLHIGRIEMVANTGTYVDAPYHFHADGVDVAQLPLERLVGVPVVIVRASGHAAIGPELLDDASALWGKAVLVHTGWSRHWGTPAYLSGSPYLTRRFAEAMVEANVALLGVDSLNVDNVEDPARPVHHTMLGNDIPLIEHLTNLDRLPDHGTRLTALPAPVHGVGSFPVRAVAVLP
ncbi:MAG: cyclase family protein [Actinomycetota bacterium]|nr:cyclase family protein [Actinomycetota bacterium]